MPATPEQIKAVLDVMVAVTELIRVAGEVPSGEIYARLMDRMDIHTYDAMISKIKRTGLVEEKNHLLIWVGPKF